MNKRILSNSVLAACLISALTGCNQNTEQSSADAQTNQSSNMGTNNNLTTNGNVKVDNSKVNERDKGSTNLTAVDQGNTAADIKVSADIRKMVVSSTNNFSTMAKNVKIITKEGKVTLRGPVSTDAEKSEVESIAKQVAGDSNVENDLEVKTN